MGLLANASLPPRAAAPARPGARTPCPPPHGSVIRCSTRSLHIPAPQARGLSTAATPGAGADTATSTPPPAAASSTPPPPPLPPTDLVLIGTIGAPHGLKGEIRVFPVTDDPEGRLGAKGAGAWAAPKSGGRALGGRAGGGGPRHTHLTLTAGRPVLLKGREVWLVKFKGVTTPEAAAVLCNQELWVSAAERPPLDGDAEFYVQELVGMAVSLAGRGDAGATTTTTSEGGGGGSGLPSAPSSAAADAPLGTVIDVYSGTGPFDTLRIALHPAGLAAARAAAAVEGGAVVDEWEADPREEDGEEDGGSPGEAAAAAPPPASLPSPPPPSTATTPTLLLPFADEFVLEVCREGRSMRVRPPAGLLGLAVGSGGESKKKRRQARRWPGRKAGGGEGGPDAAAAPAT